MPHAAGPTAYADSLMSQVSPARSGAGIPHPPCTGRTKRGKNAASPCEPLARRDLLAYYPVKKNPCNDHIASLMAREGRYMASRQISRPITKSR